MVNQIPQKRILRSWNQWKSHCLHRRPHIWNSRTSGASRHQNTRELPLKQEQNLYQEGDPIKRYTDLFKYGYLSYVKSSPFRRKRTMYHRNWAFKHTTWSTTLSPSDDATLVQFDWHALLPEKREKNWGVHFRERRWGLWRYLPPSLRGDMAIPTAIALDSSFDLLLISRILGEKDENCRHHVIILINHGQVCVVDINSRVCCLVAPGDHEGCPALRDNPQLMSITHTYPWIIP